MPERFTGQETVIKPQIASQLVETAQLTPVDQAPDTKRKSGITLAKFLPHAFRVGAIGGILLTAACSSTERQFVIAPNAWECAEVNQENYEACARIAFGHNGEIHPVGWKLDTTSPDYKESDYVSGFREVRTDWLHTEKWTQADWKRYHQIKAAATLFGIGTAVATSIVLFIKYNTHSGPYPDIGDKRAWEKEQRRKRAASQGHSYGGYGGSYTSSGSENTQPQHQKQGQQAQNPLFSARSIQPHPLEGTWFEGPKTLRGDSGGVTGHLRQDSIYSHHQIISDKSGKDVGRIEPDIIYNESNRQIIKDDRGHNVGSIATNAFGNREIKDEKGKVVGEFEKTWSGETKIKWK